MGVGIIDLVGETIGGDDSAGVCVGETTGDNVGAKGVSVVGSVTSVGAMVGGWGG